MADEKLIGKFFANFWGIIKITGISSHKLYSYCKCTIDEKDNIIETSSVGYITREDLSQYTEL